MADERLSLLKVHPVSNGLDEQGLADVSQASKLIKLDSNEYLIHSDEVIKSVYFVIFGSLKLVILDPHGRKAGTHIVSRGGMVGGIGAILAEPLPLDIIAHEPSIVLEISYQIGLELAKKHDAFRDNFLRLLANNVTKAFLGEKRPDKCSFVSIFHQSPETYRLTQRLAERLDSLGEKVCMFGRDPLGVMTGAVRYRSYMDGERVLSDEVFRQQINMWSDANRIIVDVREDLKLNVASRIIERCELVLWCVTTRNWQASISRLKAITASAPSWKDKITVIWLLDSDETCAPLAAELQSLAKDELKISLSKPVQFQGPGLVNGWERLVQRLRGVQIGVALGGGAARGMAHLGVLKAFERHGIFVDRIAGTSAGAMTGIVYASNMEVDYSIARFKADLRPSWLFRHIPKGDQWFLLYKYRRRQFDPMLRKYLFHKCLEQLPIPVSAISVDLISGNVVVRDRGDAVHAIIESINLPGLAVPINRQGQALVDGGLVNNLPADVLASKGCNFVIAVSVTNKLQQEFAQNRPDTPTTKMKNASTVETILRSYLVQSVNVNSYAAQPADFVIEPDVSRFDLTAFTRADELSAVGEKTTLEAIPKIRELLAQLDPRLFAPSAT